MTKDEYMLVLPDVKENQHLKGKELTVVLSEHVESIYIIKKADLSIKSISDGIDLTPDSKTGIKL